MSMICILLYLYFNKTRASLPDFFFLPKRGNILMYTNTILLY